MEVPDGYLHELESLCGEQVLDVRVDAVVEELECLDEHQEAVEDCGADLGLEDVVVETEYLDEDCFYASLGRGTQLVPETESL